MFLPNVKIEKMRPDALSRQVWAFTFIDTWMTLVLDHYSEQERPSKRHNFQIIRSYNRLDHRYGRIQNVKDVPIPDGLLDEAKALFLSELSTKMKVQIEKST